MTPIRICAALVSAVLAIAASSNAGAGQQTETRMVVQGVVVDARTGAPLPGTFVMSGTQSTLTDEAGRFELAVTGGTSTVMFHRLGYSGFEGHAGELPREVRLELEPLLMDEMVVRGTEHEQLAVGTALAVTSAGRDEINARGATSIAEALSTLEGLAVSRPGSWGSKAVLRGIGGERVAVLVDGNRLNRACTFGMDQGLATIDPATVERVEVLSGPGSTLYGSGNIGGVINVVTRGAGERGIGGEVRTGASTAIPGGTLGGTFWLRQDRFDASVAVDGASYDDYRSGAGTVPGSGYGHFTGGVKLGFTPAGAHRLQLQAQTYEGRDIGWPVMPGQDISIPEESRRSASLDWGWQRAGGVLDALSARAYLQRLDHHMVMEMASGSMASVTDALSHSTTAGGRVQMRLLPTDASHVDAGVEATQWAAEATRWTEMSGGMPGMAPRRITFRTWPDAEILDVGLFAQGEHRVGDLALSAGARVDRITRNAEGWDATEDWVTTGNVGMRAELGAGFSTRANLGFGFRNPDPTELFGLATRPDGFVYRGNPELETETNRNVELSVAWDGVTAGVSVTAFRNDIADMISPVIAPGDTVSGRPVRDYRNINEARLSGGTGSFRWRPLGRAELRASATYTLGEDRTADAPLPTIPPLMGSAGLRITPERVLDWVDAEVIAAARQTRVAQAAAELESPGYGVLNLRAGLDVRGVGIVTGIENVLDRNYRNHIDPRALYQPGRNLFVRLSRSF